MAESTTLTLSNHNKGRRIGPYRLEERIGVGGMGEVYRAFDERLARLVALKRIHPEAATNDRARGRFRREARTAARLNHPNIVRIHDVLTAEGCDWIVMELVEGRALDQVLAMGAPPLTTALQLAIEIAEALSAAHAEGIVHRDLKAKNVLLDRDGRAKVLDFSLAKHVLGPSGTTTSISIDGQVIGTPHAMSPEQALARKVDLRSDLFSFGTLLYEMTTGISPFRGETPVDTLTKVCVHHPPPVAQLFPGRSASLSELIGRLLEKEPAHRPQAASDVVLDLRRIAARPHASPALTAPPQGALDETLAETDRADSGTVLRTSSTERRQVTVMGLELVTTDPSSSSLAPEALYVVMEDFERLLRQVIEQAFDGHVANILGHRAVAYFGFPRAHEYDARRAVSAALQLVLSSQSLTQSLGGLSYTVKIGIHTGATVVIDSGSSTEHVALGLTLDTTLALQKRAKPGQILVGEATRQLVVSSFDLAPVPAVQIGPADIAAFQVSEAKDPSSLWLVADEAPLVGRENELRLLVDQVHLGCQGQGRVFLISGEAGIGKSRLIRAVHRRTASAPLTRLAAHGAAHAVNTPFAPAIELLRTMFSLDPNEASGLQLDRLARQLETRGLELQHTLPFLAHLLGLPFEERYPPLDLTPDQLRQRTLSVLATVLLTTADQRPVLLVFEDLHWFDPSTLELIELLIERGASASFVLILTFRPAFEAPWTRQSHLTHLNLNRLSNPETSALIERVANHKRLPTEVRAYILSQTDGIPLFVEELTKMILESDCLTEHQGDFKLTGTLSDLDLPATLRDSLTARLDRLGDVKEVAQWAAVIGREFSHQLLTAVSSLHTPVIERGLARLIDAGLVQRKGFSSRRRFQFKHALIRDAAYNSLLKRHRGLLHRRIAQTLKERFPDLTTREPELLAYHFESAHMTTEAVVYLHRAGQRATARSAHIEALRHLDKGLELLFELPSSTQRNQTELELRTTMGLSLKATKGYAADEVEETYDRVRDLGTDAGEPLDLFKSLYGQWVVQIVRGHRRRTLEIARQLLDIATSATDVELEFQALTANATTQLYNADFGKVADLVAGAMQRRELLNTTAFTQKFGEETIVLPYTVEVWRLCLCGLLDQARAMRDEMLEVAADYPPFAMTLALDFAGICSLHLREPRETRMYSSKLIEIAEENGFPFVLAHGKCLHGWAVSKLARSDTGLLQIEEGLAAMREMGAMLPFPFWSSLLVEILIDQNEASRGLTVVDELLVLSNKDSLDVFYRPELLRLRGDLLLLHGQNDAAHSHFASALATAQESNARLLALRAATSLSRMLRDAGKMELAKETLASAFDLCTEGTDTADLRVARKLLDLLRVESAA